MVSSRPRLLVVDDEPDLRTLYELTLVREGYDVDSAETVAEAWSYLQEQAYEVVVSDMRLPDGLGLELLQRLERAGRAERVVVITAYGSAENAVEALKAGAFDYLTKPVDLKQFRAVVAAASGRMSPRAERSPAPSGATVEAAGARRERVRVAAAGSPTAALARLVGTSEAITQVRGLIERVSRSMAPVLVHGESGTGKELVARAVHELSSRSAGPFVAVNCGAIPENLLEAEFFGYRKGAFTGAAEDREGFFQAAQGGTLFLDEIGDLPLAMQSKLLRVIQERAVRPVGAVAEVPTHVRIVSATHKDLAQEVQAGRFRQDLFYRLNVIQVVVPPLRERLDDLPAICSALLKRIAQDAGADQVPYLSRQALEALSRHPFAGNVRELENLLHRALALSSGDELGVADIGLAPEVHKAEDGSVAGRHGDAGAGLSPPVAAGGASALFPPPDAPLPKDLQAYLDEVEREVLHRALQKHRYNRTAAGESLGLSLRQMRYRMARLGVLSDKDVD
jgi:two-component system response regulator PilR (NtrC family)